MDYQDTRDALNGTQGMKNSQHRAETGRKGWMVTVDEKPFHFSRTYAQAEAKAEKLALQYEHTGHNVDIRPGREFTWI